METLGFTKCNSQEGWDDLEQVLEKELPELLRETQESVRQGKTRERSVSRRRARSKVSDTVGR